MRAMRSAELAMSTGQMGGLLLLDPLGIAQSGPVSSALLGLE